MKIFGIFLIFAAGCLNGCHSQEVKIRGEIKNLNGEVRLLAEMPQEKEKIVLTEQIVKNGNFDLTVEHLKMPARVWLDISGKDTLEFIINKREQVSITGDVDSIDRIVMNGAGMQQTYEILRQNLEERFNEPIAALDKSISQILRKSERTGRDEEMIKNYRLQRERFLKYRLKFLERTLEVNSENDLSLFIMMDELKDSTDMQKRFLERMKVSKRSNVYKLLAEKLN